MAQSYVIRGGVAGRERLRLLSRVMRTTTCSLFESVGLASGMACADVGCGGGDATFEIARLVGAHGRAVGFDIDATKIELARGEAADLGLSNVAFRVSEVGQIEGDAKFDLVYARFLLTHLKDPGAALTRLHALLRPGGVTAVEDIDFTGHFCHPQSSAFDRYIELYTEVVRRRGADPNIGPRLPALLLESGHEDVRVNVVQPAGLEGEVKVIAALTMENIAESLVSDGLAAADEVGALVRELYTLADDRRTLMSLPRIVQAWGRRAGTV